MNQPRIIQTGITPDVVFGNNVVVYQPVNLYGCELADDVVVGPFVEIQRGVRIGEGTSTLR